jgi:glycosyltransferase involved in cell wall biosynthesis
MLPNINGKIYNKIKNNKIILWIHDLVEKYVFMFDYNEKERNYYNDNNLLKNEVLKEFYENKNINFVFVSKFIKEKFKNYFINNNFNIEESRLNVIYNILYEEEYINIKNQDIPVNKNYITYASAWQKGIGSVIKVFKYAKKNDNNLKLVLLSPGYDWDNWTSYVNELKDKYGEDVIIHGPVNKEEYSKIVKSSLLVLSTTFEETFGCVFAESYYLGTPVIADYRSGAVKEIIDNNYIVNFDDKKETLKKIMEIKNNRENIKINLNNKFMLKENLNMWINLII